jgi:hypothetical protein
VTAVYLFFLFLSLRTSSSYPPFIFVCTVHIYLVCFFCFHLSRLAYRSDQSILHHHRPSLTNSLFYSLVGYRSYSGWYMYCTTTQVSNSYVQCVFRFSSSSIAYRTVWLGCRRESIRLPNRSGWATTTTTTTLHRRVKRHSAPDGWVPTERWAIVGDCDRCGFGLNFFSTRRRGQCASLTLTSQHSSARLLHSVHSSTTFWNIAEHHRLSCVPISVSLTRTSFVKSKSGFLFIRRLTNAL